MRFDLENLPHDVDLLHRLVRDIAAVVETRDGEIERLQLMLTQLRRAQFGKRSERVDADQLALGLEDIHADLARAQARDPAVQAPGPERKAVSRRVVLDERLARFDMTVDVEGRGCPGCGGDLHPAGETVSEMLDWVPAELRVVRIRRPKYGCRACGTIHQAPAPERVIAKGLASPSLLAHVLISKYCDHAPLYRQAGIFERHGARIERSTLAGWIGGACWWLEPLQARIAAHVFDAGRVFADDTPIPVLDPGRGRARTGRFWVYVRDDRSWAGIGPPAVACFYSPDRKAERPALHLADFRGILQVDGYSGFETLAAGRDITLAACWAHARRKFHDLHHATGSPIAAEALRRIGELYAVENGIRGQSADHRKQVRLTVSLPLVEAMKLWLEETLRRVPNRGGLPEAVRYALVRWPALCRFLDDGRIDLDNNPVERAIRPVALGRKNHLFAGSDGGAGRWATMCSLIATAKLNSVEPYHWLADVLHRMAAGHPNGRLDELLPWNWTPQSAIA